MSIERKHSSPRMSKIVIHNGTVYLCGQTASGAENCEGIEAQTEEVLRRIDTLLGEAGSSRSKLLSVTIYLRDMHDFAAMNRVWEGWVDPQATPARATVEARLASSGLKVEMTVTAASD
jgi:enamine deaminase RidA (YjgF/YER057c/UK114 family)